MSNEQLVPEVVERGAIEQLERADVDIQISTAKQYPRDIPKALDELEQLVTSSWEVAADCCYGKPQGKDIVTGPSVRFAELLAYTWRNIRAGWRLLEETERQVTVQGVAHDLEKNVHATTSVTRSIVGHHGKYPDHLIATTIAAAGSIAYRNAIFKVVPPTIARQILDRAVDKAIEHRDKILDRLHAMEISDQQIYSRLGLEKTPKPEALQRKHLQELLALGTAIKHGDLSKEEAFPSRGKGKAAPRRRQQTEGVTQRGKEPQGANQAPEPEETQGNEPFAPPDAAQDTDEPLHDPETGEVFDTEPETQQQDETGGLF